MAISDVTSPVGRQPVRIGELSRRVGVRPETLRAWERRYGLLHPLRSESGYRMYSAEDEQVIRELKRLCDEGFTTAEAARLAREVPHLREQAGHGTAKAGHAAPSQAGARVAGRAASSDPGVGAQAPAPARSPARTERLARFSGALEAFDDSAANEVVDQAVGDLSMAAVLEELILPALRRLGDRWESGDITTAQEHFASNLIRGRLLGLGRGWGGGSGPVALLACPSGERHDLALISFGLLLRECGWRILFFGQDTPSLTILETAELLEPDAVVIASVEARRLRAIENNLRKLADACSLYLAGAGASRKLSARVNATMLEGEPSYAAGVLDRTLAAAA